MVIGAFVVFISVCTGMEVVPLVATPVIPAGCVAVQLIVVFGVALLRLTVVVALPEQMVWPV